jgi:hypothetical protein
MNPPRAAMATAKFQGQLRGSRSADLIQRIEAAILAAAS